MPNVNASRNTGTARKTYLVSSILVRRSRFFRFCWSCAKIRHRQSTKDTRLELDAANFMLPGSLLKQWVCLQNMPSHISVAISAT